MRILVIDDDRSIREVAAMSLERVGGHQVVVAADSEEGIETARRHPIDLILLDAMMPGVDGARTLALLRSDARLASIPVIGMTARARSADHARLLALGAVGVILKPFDPMTLSDEIEAILAN